jgi:hypothetical protein
MGAGISWVRELERKAEYERTSPKNIPIGRELIERLNRWVDEKTASNGVEQIQFLASIIEGRGKTIIDYLRSQDTVKARRVLNQINKMAERNFHRNPQAMVWNTPLRTVKREVFGEED